MKTHIKSVTANCSSPWHVPPCVSDLLGLQFLMLAQFVFLLCFVEGWTCPQGSSQYLLMNRKNVADIAKASESFPKKKKNTIIIIFGTKVSDIDSSKCNCFFPLRVFLSSQVVPFISSCKWQPSGKWRQLDHSFGFIAMPSKIYFLWLTLSYTTHRTSNTDRVGVSLSPTIKTASVRVGLERQGNLLQYWR